MPSDVTATGTNQEDKGVAPDAVDKTPALYLRKPIIHLTSDNNEADTNSDYNGPNVDMFDVYVWEDFLTDGEILSLVNEEPLKTVLNRKFTGEELESFTWGAPIAGGNINEQCFERIWAGITQALNLIQYVCRREAHGTPTPSYIVIGDGNCARKRDHEAVGTERKKPDLAGYLFVPGSRQHSGDGPSKVHNRIPGDAKLFRKIRRSMLPPNGCDFLNQRSAQAEAQKVINQIHHYMDMHGARYGYVVNDQELIFFRRRGTGWGHMEISDAIRHDVTADLEGGVFNSKYVLFYYHYVVANDDSQWQLKSCFPNIQKRAGPQRAAKGSISSRKVISRTTAYSKNVVTAG